MLNVVGLREAEEPVPIEREWKLFLHCLGPKSGISLSLSIYEICSRQSSHGVG